MIPPVSHVLWPRTVRLIRALYPPVPLFEDIADPAAWELIAAAEAKTDPRVRDAIGAVHLVPPGRRVAGPGASWATRPRNHWPVICAPTTRATAWSCERPLPQRPSGGGVLARRRRHPGRWQTSLLPLERPPHRRLAGIRRRTLASSTVSHGSGYVPPRSRGVRPRAGRFLPAA